MHVQAKRYAANGYTVLLIGHAGHEEVVGTMGEAPDSTILVQDVAEAEALHLDPDEPVAYVTQTTLSVDETAEIIAALRRRFPSIVGPKKEDICYATSNRQWAVKDMLAEIELLLVIGSRNSSNSNRLVDVARAASVPAYLIDDEAEIDEAWLDGVETVGITSGASAPERLVTRVCDWFRARGVANRGVPDGGRGRDLPAPGRAPPRARWPTLARSRRTPRDTTAPARRRREHRPTRPRAARPAPSRRRPRQRQASAIAPSDRSARPNPPLPLERRPTPAQAARLVVLAAPVDDAGLCRAPPGVVPSFFLRRS